MKKIKVGKVVFSGSGLAFIAGPCVIESRAGCLDLAKRLVALAKKLNAPLVFKASFDKANRSAISAFRGPGLVEGLEILREIKETLGVPICTDIHEPAQAAAAAMVADILQIPAFLCRQTDLLVAAGETGCVVNIKKAQFLAAEDMGNVVAKVESTGNRNILLTERGTTFGYNNLVADMRNLLIMRQFGYPVVFDATHSVQRPGSLGGSTGGDAKWAPALARAAVATGVDGIFMETHVEPAKALSDKANAIAFSQLAAVWKNLMAVHKLVPKNG